jgi:starvation-inducible DNA-binding protein
MYEESEYELSKEGLARLLAHVLADTVTIHYLAHGYHWNVKGPEFTQFHDFFQELYEDAASAEDPTAENIRKLGFDAPHFLLELAALSCIEVRPASGDPIEMSANLYMAYTAHLGKLNDAFTVANAINSQGIANFLAERIDMTEKWLWQIGTTIGADVMSVQAPLGKSEAEVPVNATNEGMHPVVVELQPTVFTSRNALVAAGRLVPEERDLARALVEIANKYGKFDEDQTGIWADYHEPEDNPYAEMGVKCGNCVLYQGGDSCAVVAFSVKPEGYCRFAVIPDGAVDPAKAPAGEVKGEHEFRPGEFAITADAESDNGCPPATQSIPLNLKNRQNAIETASYGPLNPKEPNEEFWQDKADRWNTTSEEAKKSICGNCVFFDRRPKTLDCIETGLAQGGSGENSAWDSIDQAELGYCTAFDFKCAASRTCNAWAAGGPITEDTPVRATAGSKPAPKKDQIKGSDKNKKGSAAGGRKVTFSKQVETSLKDKVESHNKSVTADSKKVTLSMLKAVYRRGAGAFSTSHRPDQNRNSWAMGRVNAFLKLVKSGKPDNAKYTTDNDLLPSGHSKSSRTASAMTATGYADRELYIEIEDESAYSTPEDALYAMSEYSGLGHESIPIFRAAWRRAVANNESPFDRAAELAINLYDSKDADLLPKKQTESETE